MVEMPPWMRLGLGGIFVYALLNFGYYMILTQNYTKGQVPFYIELRGFSGHWMMFYGVATAGFLALGRLHRKQLEMGKTQTNSLEPK